MAGFYHGFCECFMLSLFSLVLHVMLSTCLLAVYMLFTSFHVPM